MNPLTFRIRARRRDPVFAGCAALLMACAVVVNSAPPASAVVVRAQEWPLNARHFDARSIWRIDRGKGVTVAVVDSGVDAGHPDLAGRVLRGTGFVGESGDDGRTDISSDSHGTAIAAIIAGTGAANGGNGMVGLAPQVKILPVRVAVQSQVEPAALAEGIKYAADHHAQIINTSLGSPDPDPVLRQAVAYALAKDCVVVASAGNEGQDGDPALYPAAFPGVVDVTGVDESGRFWPMSESGPRTALAAPATGIYSANDRGQYVDAEGTSYAAAYVSAAAALVRSAAPRITAAQTVARLVAAADRPHSTDANAGDEYGYGLLDPLAALRSHAATAANTVNPLLSARPAATDSRPHRTALVTGIAAGAAVLVVAVCAALAVRRRRRTAPVRATPARAPRAGRAGRQLGDRNTSGAKNRNANKRKRSGKRG